MSELFLHREDERVERPNTVANSQPAFRRVMACVDTSALARKVIPHAVAIAKAMEAALTLVRVLEPGPTGGGAAGPGRVGHPTPSSAGPPRAARPGTARRSWAYRGGGGGGTSRRKDISLGARPQGRPHCVSYAW